MASQLELLIHNHIITEYKKECKSYNIISIIATILIVIVGYAIISDKTSSSTFLYIIIAVPMLILIWIGKKQRNKSLSALHKGDYNYKLGYVTDKWEKRGIGEDDQTKYYISIQGITIENPIGKSWHKINIGERAIAVYNNDGKLLFGTSVEHIFNQV